MESHSNDSVSSPGDNPISSSEKELTDENEGYLVLAEEIDFELLDDSSERLGRHGLEQPIVEGEENQKVASLRFLKSSVGVKIEEVAWGDLDGKLACRMLLEFSIRSLRQFRIEDAYLTCTVMQGDQSSQSMNSGSTQRPQPRILRYHPRDGSEFATGEAGTEIVETLTVAPELSLPSGFGLKIGSLVRQKTYTPVYGLEISGDANFEDSETVLWSIGNRSPNDRNFVHDVDVELLIEHHNENFRVEFEIEAKLNFGNFILAIRKSRNARKHRNFTIFPSVVKFKVAAS